MSRSNVPTPIRVFAYGSNMCLPHLSEWARTHGFPEPRILDARRGALANFRLTWNYRSRRQCGAANVVRAPDQVVHGAVIVTDAAGLEVIDEKEGTPLYYSRTLERVDVGGDLVEAWVYQVNERWLEAQPVWPDRRYLDTVLAGARAHDLPADYVSALASLPVVEAA